MKQAACAPNLHREGNEKKRKGKKNPKRKEEKKEHKTHSTRKLSSACRYTEAQLILLGPSLLPYSYREYSTVSTRAAAPASAKPEPLGPLSIRPRLQKKVCILKAGNAGSSPNSIRHPVRGRGLSKEERIDTKEISMHERLLITQARLFLHSIVPVFFFSFGVWWGGVIDFSSFLCLPKNWAISPFPARE